MMAPAVCQQAIKNSLFFTHRFFVPFITKPKIMTVTFATIAAIVKNKCPIYH
jgi:hypothetical protein